MTRPHEQEPHTPTDGLKPVHTRPVSPPSGADPHRPKQERQTRASHRRETNENEKVVIGLLIAAGVIGCYLFARTVDIQNGRSLAGAAVLCFAVPTLLFFFLYEPFWNFVRRIRNRRK